jgi:voltage-gated potassium channel
VFESAYLEIVVGALVLVSVILTLIEFMQVAQDSHPQAGVLLARINDGITAIFIVELGLRAIVARSKRRYLNEYFLDIVAVLPFWLILPGGRALRMLRLVRLLRMFGVVSRLSGHFPYVIRRGAVEYMMVMGLLVLTIVFATGAIMFFENQDVRDQPAFGLEDSFWFSIYSLFAGEPIPGPPQTLGGKIVAVFVMFMGLTIFAMFTGTVSAFMVQRIHMEGEFVDWDGLQDHVIICGWSTKAEIIIAEYRATPSMR